MNERNQWRLAKGTVALGLLVAMLCGGAIRVYQAWTASVIARDGITYVSMAYSMRDDWRAGVPELVQFGYPLLIKWTHMAVGQHFAGDELMQFQRSAQLVSIVCGTLCIPAIYWLGRRLLSRRVGLLAAWAWALLPDAVRFSADALSDMPCLMFILWAVVLAMIALQQRSIGHFVWAGLLSGAAYAIREEGGIVAFVAVLLVLIHRRCTLFWRATAITAIVAGFSILGGSYIWIEGGVIFSEKPYLHVENWIGSNLSSVLAMFSSGTGIGSGMGDGVYGSGYSGSMSQPILAALDYRPLTEQLKDLPQVSWTLVGRQAAISMWHLLKEMAQSLNGVWMVLGFAYFVLPGRMRFRRGWRRLPMVLVVIYTVILLILLAKCGYLSRRHVLLLNVWVMIAAAGSLVWIANRLRIQLATQLAMKQAAVSTSSWPMLFARRADALIVAVIVLGTIPWLLRDIGEGRWFVHDAARWVQQQYPNRSDVRIVSRDGWVPFNSRQLHWDQLPWYQLKFDTQEQLSAALANCDALFSADLLVLEHKWSTLAPAMVIRPSRNESGESETKTNESVENKTVKSVRLTAAATFPDARNYRGVTLYRVDHSPSVTMTTTTAE